MRTAKEVAFVASSRLEYRTKLVTLFLEEAPGSGRGDLCTEYIYYVDRVNDGNRVFLKRPARLNKGFDFEVHIENYNFGNKRQTSMPSHRVIMDDLKRKKEENGDLYREAKKLIDIIFRCHDIEVGRTAQIAFRCGYPFDTMLKAIKWLFIEQDVTYWNWSGRHMLYSAICSLD